VYEHDPSVARRLLVMAHWRLTPAKIKKLSSDDLSLMEFSYLLLERRQSETLDNLFGSMLGSSFDVTSLLGDTDGKKKPKKKDNFTWSFREKTPKVQLPVTLALTQNPKFMQHLKALASKAKTEAREDPSVLNVPKGFSKKKTELVDLSYVSKEEFLKIAGHLPSD